MAIYCVYSGGNGTSGAVAGSVPTSGEWATAYQSISACLTAVTEAAGDTIFVAHDHSVSAGAAITLTINNFVYIVSIDRANTTTATQLSGAIESTNANFAYIFAGSGGSYVYGITFKSGSGGANGNAAVSLVTAAGRWEYDQCIFDLNSTSAGNLFNLGVSSIAVKKLVLRSCSFKFGATGQGVRFVGAMASYFINCSVDAAGSTPAALFQYATFSAPGGIYVYSSACDFSKSSALINISASAPGLLTFANCIVPSNITTGTHSGTGGAIIEAFACSSSTDDNIYQYYYRDGAVTISHNTGVYLTSGGATFKTTDGSSVAMSLMAVTSSECNKLLQAVSPWFNVEVASTGSKTFTINIANTTAVLKDNEAWIEVEYYGSTANPLSSNAISAPVISGTQLLDVLSAGSNMTDTAVGWTGITSEFTHSLSKTVTVNQQGFARARVVLAKASTTVYVDPKVIVS